MSRIARSILSLSLLVLFAAMGRTAEEAAPPPGDKTPVLRIEPEGATSHVTALALSADGKTLYAGGWDKVIRVWTLNDKDRFVPARVSAYRVPIGPGVTASGAINAMALSRDDEGVWLAAAGSAVIRGGAGFANVGYPLPGGDLTEQMLEDSGTITVFNTRDGSARQLRGQRGYVNGLAFAHFEKGKPPLLLSIAWEPVAGERQWKYRCSARLWDVARRESTHLLSNVLETSQWPPPQPGLALWHTEGTGVRAAMSFGDGAFRVWNVNQKGLPREADDVQHTTTVVRLPSNTLLTASYGQGGAQFRQWSVGARGEPTLIGKPPAPPDAKITDSFPQALVLLSRRAASTADLAVVALGPPRGKNENRLQIVDIAPGKLGTVLASSEVWRSTIRPVLATSLRGRFVAVAGFPDHQVRIYAADSLVAGEKAPRQVLRSVGTTFEHVAFARKGKDLGLLLNRTARRGPGEDAPAADEDKNDLVFAIRERRVINKLAGWKTAAPPSNGWRVRYSDDKQRVVTIHDGKRQVQQIQLPPGHELTDYALLAPGPGRKTPMLALATRNSGGEPRLVLYNAQNGKEVRHFKGHTDRITAIAFSDDGRLLASVSQDQTVCVWSLTTLDQINGKFGILPGIAVSERGGVLTVSRAAGKLRKGDPVLGLVEGKELQRLTSAAKFYEAIHLKKPGSMVTLRIGPAEASRDVKLEVAQGPDMRNPLFTWFMLTGERDWIGWHPLGPFDASSPRAESHLGWHFNTGDPKQPTRFAPVGAHRKEFYREGLLDNLVNRGRLLVDGRPLPPALPDPEVFVLVKDGDRLLEAEGPQAVKVGQPRVELRVSIQNRPLATLSELTYKVDGGPEQKLDLDRSHDDAFVLPVPKLERGKPRVVEITARTRDIAPRSFPVRLALSYQPDPPVIYYGGKRILTVKEPRFNLRAKVIPSRAGEKIRLTLRQSVTDAKPPAKPAEDTEERAVAPGDTLTVDRALDLKEGKNIIVLEARNSGAPRGEEDETQKLELEVFLAKKAPPPAIVLGLPDPDGKEMVVTDSEVFVSGTMSADEVLRTAELIRPRTRAASTMSGFKPGSSKSFAFKEKLTLNPGRQEFIFRATAVNSHLAERKFTIEYRPGLPQGVVIIAPVRDETWYGEKEIRDVEVRGRITVPRHGHPYRVVLMVDDEEQGKLDIDERAGTFTVPAKIKPGQWRTIRIKVSNEWNPARTSDAVRVKYLRPPVFVDVRKKPAPGKRKLDFVARVRSPLPLNAEHVRVEVNGEPYSLAKVPEIKESRAGEHAIELNGVDLQADRRDNLVRVWVSNAEGESRAPGLSEHIDLVRESPPEFRIDDPKTDERSVAEPHVRVKFEVRSVTPLTKVELVRIGSGKRVPIPVAKVRRDTDRMYRLTTELNVPLECGVNSLRLEATNSAGWLPGPILKVTYVPPPLRVEVDHLVDTGKGGMAHEVRRAGAGKISFEDMEQGKVRLEGRLVRISEKIAWDRYPKVRVFVNGFQQVDAKTFDNNKLERRFRTTILLNRAKRNVVEVVLLQSDDRTDAHEIPRLETRTVFEVNCHNPVEKQRLHLLLLSPVATDEEQVKAEFEKAIAPARVAFATIEAQKPLIGRSVNTGRILGKLFAIQENIRDHREESAEPMNDVVMIYYQGREAIRDAGNFFRLPGLEKDAKGSDISCREVVKMLAETSGAHVLLLDCQRDTSERGTDKVGQWSRHYPSEVQSHFVVIRHAWRGKDVFPQKARLISVLQEALPKVARLRDLELRMKDIRKREQLAELLVTPDHVPETLKEMRFGR
jgi:WD40 repeat protein